MREEKGQEKTGRHLECWSETLCSQWGKEVRRLLQGDGQSEGLLFSHQCQSHPLHAGSFEIRCLTSSHLAVG